MKPITFTLVAALTLGAAAPAFTAPAKKEKGKGDKANKLAYPKDEDTFDPTDPEAAKEYGVSAAKIKKIEDYCRTHLRDEGCVARKKAKVDAARAKAKSKPAKKAE